MRTENAKSKAAHLALRTILVGYILVCATGCGEGGSKEAVLTRQIEQLTHDKAQLTRQAEQCKSENQQLTRRMEALSALPKDKLDNPYRVERVKLTGYTNFYDKDKDGKKEKLIVYIQPIDSDGDIVKAAGAVEVQLWNLNNVNEKALLGRWRVEPGEMRKLWFATLITSNYRLTFDVGDKISGLAEPLTVKVTFTDYLTGQAFEEQRLIKPQ